ncbi:MAG: MaoC/PaaZ C-terminal domain-containing protein [Granulosicoccus sp.]
MNMSLSESHHTDSYACGEWVRGSGDARIVLDAATGAPVSRIDSTGLDFQDMLSHARSHGGSSLRAMSFHQRALLLKRLGQALTADKELFYAYSAATGATRTDSWIDIDGGISTFYAHTDEEAAKANPFFDGRVAHGYPIVSFAAGLFVDPAPCPVLANYGVDNLRFMTPVYPEDTLQLSLTCKAINPRETDEYGEVRWG